MRLELWSVEWRHAGRSRKLFVGYSRSLSKVTEAIIQFELSYIHGTHQTERDRLASLNRLTNRPFIEFLGLQGHERVLEVGSGLGILASEVAQGLPDGSIVGVEYSVEQLEVAHCYFPNLGFVQGDAHYLPFPAETFDVAYCRYVLEYVSDVVSVLREMRRVLRRVLYEPAVRSRRIPTEEQGCLASAGELTGN